MDRAHEEMLRLFYQAIRNSDTASAEELLTAAPFLTDDELKQSLYLTACAGNRQLLQRLLSSTAFPITQIIDSLLWDAESDAVVLLLKEASRQNRCPTTVLETSAYHRNPDALQKLLDVDSGLSFSAVELSRALDRALLQDASRCAEILFAAGAQLLRAAEHGETQNLVCSRSHQLRLITFYERCDALQLSRMESADIYTHSTVADAIVSGTLQTVAEIRAVLATASTDRKPQMSRL